MKTILGLDIGVTSLGLAIISDNDGQKKIEKLAVRIIPEKKDFHGNFISGNTASKNLERTLKRGIRRNNQRFKARRDKLYQVLRSHNMFPEKEYFTLSAKELYRIRAKAVTEKITLPELGRVLILLNKRRGFKSNRKSNTEEEKRTEYKNQIASLESDLAGKTIGQKFFSELENSENDFEVLLRERTYLRSTYEEEFDRIWEEQKKHHPILTGGSHEGENPNTLYDLIRNRIIFYQRDLKSQKGLIAKCPFEKHHRRVPKSSPFFELFRTAQQVNNVSWDNTTGEKCFPTEEQKQKIKNALWYGEGLNNKYKLSVSKIKSLLGFGKNDKIYLNFTELDGSRTYSLLKSALLEASIENPEKYLYFNTKKKNEKGGLFELWHITYSLETEEEVINALKKRFHFTEAQSQIIAKKVSYKLDYGSLSTRAIRKLLPHLEKGLMYSKACDAVGYDHSGSKTKVEVQPKLEPIKQNTLRNPVVEQILNQLVNVVNMVIEKYGKPDEIRVELARELRNNAETRKKIANTISKNKKENDKIRTNLLQKHGFKIVNGRDISRYKLWEETNKKCLYCSKPISGADMLTGNADSEHILPKSRSFDNSMNNLIISHRKCNLEKEQRTAYDFMALKGTEILTQYIEKVNDLYKDGEGTISKTKLKNLLCKGENIPPDFVARMLKDTQYMTKEAVRMLKTVCPNVYTTTGQITDYLRKEWNLKEVLKELCLPKYQSIPNGVKEKEIKDGQNQTKTILEITNWSKRSDHRHHAVDALICALTDQKIIFKLNNLNKIYLYQKNSLSEEALENVEKELEQKFTFKEFADQQGVIQSCPIPNIKSEAKKHLESLLISFKKENSKVLTKKMNKPKHAQQPQITWVPRARLHEDTIMGKTKRVAAKKMKLDKKVTLDTIENVVSSKIRDLLQQHLTKFDNNPAIAFATQTLKKSPIMYKGERVKEVAVYEWINTKRVAVNENITAAQIKNIIDKECKDTLEDRLEAHGGKTKEAFKNVKENPIYLKNGMLLKSVTVADESKVIMVRKGYPFLGQNHHPHITIENNGKLPKSVTVSEKSKEKKHKNGYALSGKNHHALIYKDENGNFNDKVVSFWEAVKIGQANIKQTGSPNPIINKNDDSILGTFQFSIQINELFVFDVKHAENPKLENEIDFLDPKNRKLMSEKLFRVQKMSKSKTGEFRVNFRHHLETETIRKNKEGKPINERELKGIAWESITSNKNIARLTKIEVDHLGNIRKVG